MKNLSIATFGFLLKKAIYVFQFVALIVLLVLHLEVAVREVFVSLFELTFSLIWK